MDVPLSSTGLRSNVPSIVALLLALGVAVAIGRTYFGSSSSPYGMCAAPSGRQVECATLRATAR